MKLQLERRRAVTWLASALALCVLAACRTTPAAKDETKPEKQGEDGRYTP